RDRERGRHGEHARAADGENAVQLGEADVVADRQAEPDSAVQLGEDDLIAGFVRVRLAVDAPAHLDVEEVDLAIRGPDLAVGTDMDARVAMAVVALAALDDRTRHGVDPAPIGRLAS